MINKTLSTYINKIHSEYATGLANEHSYRSHLQTLVESYSNGVQALNEPKQVECGAPDFIVQRNHVPIGHIECKDVDANLNKTEKSEQLKRYFSALPNFILTDYLEFRYFFDGELVRKTRVAQIDQKGVIKSVHNSEDELAQLFDAFFSAEPPNISNPLELADRLARLARQIRYSISKVLEQEAVSGSLHNQLNGFKDVLLHDLTHEQFADMYSQTICYGLFSAICTVPANEYQKFSREHAAYHLPKTNPFLRSLFSYIAGPDLDSRIVWIVEDVVMLLKRANITEILKDFGKATKQEDPVVHFYETFLAQYDPQLRETRGVYYTPEPVVSYIVRSIDHILKEDFGLPDGLAHAGKIQKNVKNPQTGKEETQEYHQVQILDPATGTGTFLHGVINHIHDSMAGNKGMWSGYVSEHLLPRLNGFELLMAPYAVAHMKLGLLLQETGYDFLVDERLRVYLTNTLEEAEYHSEYLFGQMIAKEANSASDIKRQYPIMVILGNPPYSAESLNKGKWIEGLVRKSYYPQDALKEKNPKLLLDDYVKFIRFSQYRIDKTGYGILAFICNHGFLDNPTFRAMRQSLMDSFDDLYLLDLHGNVKKRDQNLDGTKDENVFDIQQGVAICLFVKKPQPGSRKSIKHAHCYGDRKTKHQWLMEKNVANTKWTRLKPQLPFNLFIPYNIKLLPEYEKGIKITDIFIKTSTGIKSHRDHFVFDFDYNNLYERIKQFRNLSISDEQIRDTYNLSDTRDWKLYDNRRTLKDVKDWEKYFTNCLYRPFDIRKAYYHPCTIELTRHDVMSNVINKKNWGLIYMRQVALSGLYSHFLVSNIVVDNRAFYSNKGTMSLAPLYIDDKNGDLFKDDSCLNTPNLTKDFIAQVSNRTKLEFIQLGKGNLKKTFGPEDVFHYLYAVFHSPTYRSRYAEFLRIDFPRLPLTSNIKLFQQLCALGEELVGLHLLERVPKAFTTYPIKGGDTVEKVRYQEPMHDEPGRVYINNSQYFENVPTEVWDFHIGGYQVCEKWLKDRKGRALSYDDIRHYTNITVALSETIRIMQEIDDAIPEWPIT